MTDLDKLIAAVEAGEWLTVEMVEVVCAKHGTLIMAAYDGSLDASQALHEALLPGHTRAVDATAPEMGIRVDVWSPDGPITGTGDGPIEARSWLLAILRALKAQGGDA